MLCDSAVAYHVGIVSLRPRANGDARSGTAQTSCGNSVYDVYTVAQHTYRELYLPELREEKAREGERERERARENSASSRTKKK